MRWFWIDRFTEFVSGRRATAVKGVSLSEEVVDEYAPGGTFLPASLIVEGMAQCGGLLISQMTDFKNRIVLAKVSSCEFHQQAYPGSVLEFRCERVNSTHISAVVAGSVSNHLGPVATLELMFATLQDDRFSDIVLFEPAAFCRWLRLLRLFDVGILEDGTPIPVPEHMLAAEKAELML